jgi:hypothetical protein
MTMSYQYTDTSETAVKDTNTGATIPINENNRRYRNEVKPWLDAGNTPLPAPEEPTPAPATLPVIQGTTDSEKLASVISILQANGIATGE